MNSRCMQPDAHGLEAQALSLPGYGRDLEVRPYPLSARSNEAAIRALCAEGVSGFLGRMTASRLAERRLH